jgi:Tol biopolymer transport system component
MSPDGKTIVFNAIYGNNTFNLETMSLEGEHALHDVAASSTAVEGNGRFSRDGHFIAYASNESGTAEIYVKPFPGDGGRVQISSGGGVKPRWAPDGKTIYYWQGKKFMATTIASSTEHRPLATTTLFEGSYEQDFDVSPDGSRFLMIESATSGLEMIVIPNWKTELRRLTAQRRQN